jgi:uncharacterized protein
VSTRIFTEVGIEYSLSGGACAYVVSAAGGAARIIALLDREEASMLARQSFRVLAGALCVFALMGVVLAQSAPIPANKVVMQVSDGDPGKWNLALNNARNLQADLGAKNVDIEIVVYGPGIGMLKSDSVIASRVGEALDAGVKIVACENTMRGQKLAQPDMLGGISYVGAGVVEIMQRQQQGWAYLRP